ncbi:MAG: hypothetical protein J5938_00020 [Clostridia bacterium]|nr:hypothetical protein [Clostridia bacterium]
MKKKLLAAACLLLAFAAVSCTSETPEKPADSSESPSSASEPETDPRYDIPEPELPELDLTGQKYTFYTQVNLENEDPDELFHPRDFLWVEGLIGEVVNDAVFNRNLKVEQKFGCKVTMTADETRPDVLIMAGDSTIDMVCGGSVLFGDTIYTGAYMNFKDLPYCNLESEYWNPSCVRDTVYKGKLYMMANDVCLSPLSTTGFLYFNKRLVAEHDLESPYQMVYDNTWTIDNFLSMVKMVHGDTNGDGIYDTEDLYGALVKAEFRMGCFLQFYFGSGKTFTVEDPDEGRVIAVDGDFAQNLIDKLYPVLEDRTVCLNNYKVRDMTGDTKDKAYKTMFLEGHCLFIQEEIAAMELFRNMEDDYGIVPNPKYDSNQSDYYHRVFPHAVMFAAPVTIQDLEKTGAVTEYMAWLSHYTVLPAYYEITVKQKRTRDEDAVNMLDIIRRSMVFEFGDVYDSYMPNYMWNSYTDRSFSRKFGASLKILQKRLKKYTKMLDSLD